MQPDMLSPSPSFNITTAVVDQQLLEFLRQASSVNTSGGSKSSAEQTSRALEAYCDGHQDALQNLATIFLQIASQQTSLNGESVGIATMAGLILKNRLKRILMSSRDDDEDNSAKGTGKAFSAAKRAAKAFARQLVEPLAQVASANNPCPKEAQALRSTAGTILTAIFDPETMSQLTVHLAKTATPGALHALHKILEEWAYELVSNEESNVADKTMQACLMALVDILQHELSSHGQSSSSVLLEPALQCLNDLVLHYADGFGKAVPSVMTRALGPLAQHPSPAVRKGVCEALGHLTDTYAEEMEPFLPEVLEHQVRTLESIRLVSDNDTSTSPSDITNPTIDVHHDDTEVAMQAAEFFQTLAESLNVVDELEDKEKRIGLLARSLPRLIPALLRLMVLKGEDPEWAAWQDGTDAPSTPDEPLAPKHHEASSGRKQNEQDEDGDDSDEELDMDDEDEYVWTVRKACATALDMLAVALPAEPIMATLLPLVQHVVASAESARWRHLEAALLAVGAVAEGVSGKGYTEQVTQSLVQGCLIPVLTKGKPGLLRAMAAWVSGKLAAHVPYTSLAPLIASLAPLMRDPESKRAQWSASNALRLLYEVVGEAAEKEDDPASQSLVKEAFKATPLVIDEARQAVQDGQTGKKTLFAICDVVEAVASGLGGEMAASNAAGDKDEQPALLVYCPAMGGLVEALLGRWFAVPLEDGAVSAGSSPVKGQFEKVNELFPLLEAICALAIAVGSIFAPVVGNVFERAQITLETSLAHIAESAKTPTSLNTDGEDEAWQDEAEEDDVDCAVMSLDLMDGLVQGCGTVTVVSALGGRVAECLRTRTLPSTLLHAHPDIRQSAWGLVGDMAASLLNSLPSSPAADSNAVGQVLLAALPEMPILLEAAAQCIRPAQPSVTSAVANNAVWAVGELVRKGCLPHQLDVSGWVTELRNLLLQGAHIKQQRLLKQQKQQQSHSRRHQRHEYEEEDEEEDEEDDFDITDSGYQGNLAVCLARVMRYHIHGINQRTRGTLKGDFSNIRPGGVGNSPLAQAFLAALNEVASEEEQMDATVGIESLLRIS